MKSTLTIFFLILWGIQASFATNYYVRTDGNDANAGMANTASGAFRTIGKACAIAQPGDVVNVADGTYIEGEIKLRDKKGSKTNTFTLRAINRHKAIISSITGGSVLSVANSAGIVIDGFEVTCKDPRNSYLFGILSTDTHWVTVRNCFVHDIGSSGIQINSGEYFVIENNILRDNGKNTGNPNGSGISVYHPKYSPNYVAGEWGIIIRNNVCFENVCPYNLIGYDSPTDGNGIILDDFRNVQGGGQPNGYMHPSLVENNLCFNNGGRGVHIFQTDNVTVRNNTLYHNNFELSKYYGFGWNGDLNIDASANSKIYNNIVVMDNANPRGYALLVPMDADVRSNLIIGGAAKSGRNGPVEGLLSADNKVQGLNNQQYVQFKNPTVSVDPLNISTPLFSRFFGLAATSPAIDAGNNTNAPTTDQEGNTRPAGKGIDIGSYESGGTQVPSPTADTQPPSVPTGLAASGATTTGLTLNWAASSDNVGVTGYDIFVGGTLAGSAAGTSFLVTGLAAGTAYNLTVRARDAAGNASAASTPLTARTAASPTPTPAPTPAGAGLKGEFFNQFGYGLAAARAAIASATPLHRFTARAVDYPAGTQQVSTQNWNVWLGADGTGAPAEPVQTSVLRLGGYIQIKPEHDLLAGNSTIEVHFALSSQGSAALRLNGTQVLANEANWTFSTVSSRVSFPSAGFYPIELLHGTAYDASGVELYSSIPGTVRAGGGAGPATTIVPVSVLFTQLPGGARVSAEAFSAEPAAGPDLAVSPNPAGTNQTVRLYSKRFSGQEVHVQVKDLAGNTVFLQRSQFQGSYINLALKPLRQGMYLILITDGTDKQHGKLVIH